MPQHATDADNATTRAYYELVARQWNPWMTAYIGDLRPAIARTVRDLTGDAESIVEIGAGAGWFTPILKNGRQIRYHAIDPSPTMLAQLDALDLGVTTEVANALDWVTGETFTITGASHVVSHLGDNDVVQLWATTIERVTEKYALILDSGPRERVRLEGHYSLIGNPDDGIVIRRVGNQILRVIKKYRPPAALGELIRPLGWVSEAIVFSGDDGSREVTLHVCQRA